MAKGRIKLPPRKNIGATVKKIISQSPRTQPSQTLAKGKSQSFVKQVQQSKIPKPTANQRGKIKTLESNSLIK